MLGLDAGHPGGTHMQQATVDHQSPNMPRDVVGGRMGFVQRIELREQGADSFQARRTAPQGIGHLRLSDVHSQPYNEQQSAHHAGEDGHREHCWGNGFSRPTEYR